MDWNQELIASLTWLGKAFAISLLGLTVAAWALGRFTDWGRAVARLAWPWFSPKRSLWPLAGLTAIVFMALFSVRMNVLFSFWYNGFYTALQKLDAPAFWILLGVFSVLAAIHVARALLGYYLEQAFLIHWRSFLTEHLVNHWTQHQGYYRARFAADGVDNPDQRIQQDIKSFTDNSLKLSVGLLKAVVSLFEFTIVLWGLSGALAVMGVEIPRAMVFCVYAYVLVATVFAVWIGRPLIRLNFANEKLNANFRYALMRVREYGEGIAFYKGEVVERSVLLRRFSEVIANAWALVRRSLQFQGFNLTVSQAAVVFPFIVQAPRLFSKEIALGDVMQTVEAFGQVQDALSFVRESYDEFASYRAVLNRLNGFLDTMDAVEQLPALQAAPNEAGLVLRDLTVRKPDGSVLLNKVSLSVAPGTSLLVRGPSGAGKTTLLRALAGLWPFAEGTLQRPNDAATLFLPQKPYLPLGTLVQTLCYPAQTYAREQIASALTQCQLSHLIARLDEDADWSAILSLGEQQRLAIGRALLARPTLLFLDESSSAMDEGLEHAMYALLQRELPHTTMVSIGHRSSLRAFHHQTLELLGDGNWATNAA